MTTWHLVGLWWDHRLWILNVLLHSYHNPLALHVIFSLLFLASMLWHYQDIPPTSYEICIITRYLFKKISFYWLLSMEMFFLNCHPCLRLHTCLHKCRAWIENMMAVFGAGWSQPISRIILGLISKKLVAWVTYGVCMMIMKTLCALALAMKSSNVVNAHIF